MIRLLAAYRRFLRLHPGQPLPVCAGKMNTVSSPKPAHLQSLCGVERSANACSTVQNTGAAACSYQVSIPPSFYPLQFAGKLSFSMSSSSASANSMLHDPNPQARPVRTTAHNTDRSPGAAVIIWTLHLEGRVRLGSCRVSRGAAPYRSGNCPPTCTVPPIFEINLAGSGAQDDCAKSGNLEAGQKASVIVQTRTNNDHRLVFQSVNGGYLSLHGHSGPASKIPYSATVDGETVTLTAPVALSFATEPGEASRRVTVTVGDTSGKLA